RLASLARMFDGTGHHGLVLTMDEAETIDQLWDIRSRVAAYAVLGTLCRMKGMWPVFGITERFHRTLELDLRRGVLDRAWLPDPDGWFVNAWRHHALAVVDAPELQASDVRSLVTAVCDLYTEAYGPLALGGALGGVVETWMGNPSRNPRRLIRLVIDRLDRAR